MTHTYLDLLSSAPSPNLYCNLFKIGGFAVLAVLWGMICQWVDRDIEVVKTKREQWNFIVVAGGLAGFVVSLLVPWPGQLFFLGMAFWIVLSLGAVMIYVFHRNGRVIGDSKVMTVGHFKRSLSGMKSGERVKDDKGLRIQLMNFEGKRVEQPDTPVERKLFDSAQDLIFDVLWKRSLVSDFVIGKERVRMLYKIDGVVAEQPVPETMTPESVDALFAYIKQIAGLNSEERRRPQVGKIKAGLLGDNNAGDIEIKTSGSTQGERLRVRVLAGSELRRLPEIGLAEPRLEMINSVIQAEGGGIFIVSGPPESGVTTTQYAIIRDHDAYMQNIYSLERQPMLDLDNITQNIYKGEAEESVSHARMLQTVLRREPDVVLIGDGNDRETIHIAANSAEEKKIYLTLPAKSTIEALGLFLSLLENNKLASKVFLGAINQRLVRVLCPACRIGYRPDAAKLKKLNLPADKIENFYSPPTEPVLDKKGREIICQTCQGSGYVGRTGVFEVLKADENIRAMIADGAPLKVIKQQLRKAKMYYLMEEGLLKVIDGTTSMDEVLRVMREEPNK